VGAFPAGQGDPWWQVLTFVGLTLLLLALPLLIVRAVGIRGRAFLPEARDWMNNSWVVSEIVLLFFLGIIINSLVG
jgi:hypothetical protein